MDHSVYTKQLLSVFITCLAIVTQTLQLTLKLNNGCIAILASHRSWKQNEAEISLWYLVQSHCYKQPVSI